MPKPTPPTELSLADGKAEKIDLGSLLLDPENPRFASGDIGASQEEILKVLWRDMAVDEVAFSVAANGFFPEEPLFVVPGNPKKAEQKDKYIVVEGNRRLAAVILLKDGKLRNKVKATDLPAISSTRRDELSKLPVVIYASRESLWMYCGFRHINGTQPWDAFSKAKYVTQVFEEYGVALEEIADRIGDRHATVKRLYRGYKVLQQAEAQAGFNKEDRFANRFYFSHLYTALDQPDFLKHLGITSEGSLKANPVPKSKLGELAELTKWIYGSKSTNTEPLIRRQNPDLNNLREVISKPAALSLLRAGYSLDRAHDVSRGDQLRFREALTSAKEEIQQAKATVTKGFRGETDLFEMAKDVALIASELQDEMKSRVGKKGEALDRAVIPLPDKPTESIKLADWMELCALIAPDGDVSREDLDSALRTAAIFPPHKEDEKIEDLILEVFRELEARSSAALDGYSFDVVLPYLKVRKDWKKSPAYAFCLCLSYFGEPNIKNRKSKPRRWFEHISRDAAMNYLNGEAVRFASPRHVPEVPANFGKAIKHICTTSLMEGSGYKEGGGLPNQKDCHVDIIAWKHFPDRSVGKIVLFGNCATSNDWNGLKLTELTPNAFCDEWMLEPPPSPIISSFFIPHRCDSKAFKAYSRRAGIIFDRCRIAYWCHKPHTKKTPSGDVIYTDLAGITDWIVDHIVSKQA